MKNIKLIRVADVRERMDAHYLGEISYSRAVELLNEDVNKALALQWVAVEDAKPKECESLIGIEMPYEARYACHREDNLYVSDETGESVYITHWMYAPEPPVC